MSGLDNKVEKDSQKNEGLGNKLGANQPVNYLAK